jgi:tetratricopeptide (TPR) repeat protein
MRRIRLLSSSLLALLTLGVLTSPVWAEDEATRQQILAFSKITGNEPLGRQMKSLLENPANAKKILATAKTMLKEGKHPFSYNAALLLGSVAGELKDLDTAQAFLRLCMDKAVKLQSSRKIAQAYGALIETFYDNKKFAESAKVCRELLELKVDDGKAREILLAVDKLDKFGEPGFVELERYEPAEFLRPFFHRLLIKSIARQGKYDEALRLADNLAKASDHWQDRELKGWVQHAAGQNEEAAKTYEDVLQRIAKDKELEKEEKELYSENYQYLLSGIYVDLKRIDKAADQLKALLEKRPDSPTYNNDLGYIWADHNMNLAEAERLIRKALELDAKARKKAKVKPEDDRDNGAYLDSLGWVLFKQKKYKEAKEVMLKAVEDKSAQHIEIYDHLGDVHMALGEKEAAIAAWQKGVELAGSTPREKQRKVAVEKKLKAAK